MGRSPNGHNIAAEAAGVSVDDKGFISSINSSEPARSISLRSATSSTTDAGPQSHPRRQGRCRGGAGLKSGFEARVIPSVAYTDPEVAWVGLTETEATAQGIDYEKGVFPWAASGRALALARSEGFTKLLFDPATQQIIGAGIVGPNAGDLIAEVGLAIEMNCVAQDICLTVHPHPTLRDGCSGSRGL